ncbi:LytR/AlgR family response regulator transcription factor [candidate division KSB1 bacterium]
MFTFLKQPYPLSVGAVSNYKIIAGLTLFVFLFLMVFQPFRMDRVAPDIRLYLFAGYSITCFIVLSANYLVAPRLLKERFSEDTWTVQKEILWVIWLIFAVNAGIYIFQLLFDQIYNFIRPGFSHFLRHLMRTYILAVIPFAAFTLLKLNVIHKRNAEEARRITASLSVTMKKTADVTENDTQEESVILSEKNREKHEFPVKDILFIASDGNYINVVYENEKIRSTLIRNSMKNIEKQVSGIGSLFRCHRSYIVNIRKVTNVSGNAQGLKLSLDGYERMLPVARSFCSKFRKMIETEMHS